MLRAIVLGLVMSGAAQADPPGEPFSQQRYDYCQAAKSACEEGAPAQCASAENPAICLEDALTQCSKDFEYCMEAGAPAPPSPPAPTGYSPTCKDLFAKFRDALRRAPNEKISVLWTTNYDAHNERWVGWSHLFIGVEPETTLPRRGPFDIYGRGLRWRQVLSGGSYSEKVALRIRADNRVVLSDIYGPYEVACSVGFTNAFAAFYSGDSYEVFGFRY